MSPSSFVLRSPSDLQLTSSRATVLRTMTAGVSSSSTKEHTCPLWAFAVSATAELGTFPNKARMTHHHPGQEEKAYPQSEQRKLHLLPPIPPHPLLLALTSLALQGAVQGPGTSAAPGSLEALQRLRLTHTHRISICILRRPPVAWPSSGSLTLSLLLMIRCMITLY